MNQLGRVAENSSVELSYRFYVTCLCNPEAIPPIPNSAIEVAKPSVSSLLTPLIRVTKGGGVGVAASGPESLTCAAQNAVAGLGSAEIASAGGIDLHTELFAL
jgi:ferric-chelate reductase